MDPQQKKEDLRPVPLVEGEVKTVPMVMPVTSTCSGEVDTAGPVGGSTARPAPVAFVTDDLFNRVDRKLDGHISCSEFRSTIKEGTISAPDVDTTRMEEASAKVGLLDGMRTPPCASAVAPPWEAPLPPAGYPFPAATQSSASAFAAAEQGSISDEWVSRPGKLLMKDVASPHVFRVMQQMSQELSEEVGRATRAAAGSSANGGTSLVHEGFGGPTSPMPMSPMLGRGLEGVAGGAGKAPLGRPTNRSTSPRFAGPTGCRSLFGPGGTFSMPTTPPPPGAVRPCGTHVKVVGAQGLRDASQNKSDLYVTCEVISGGSTVRNFETKVVWNGRPDPTWNEDFSLTDYIPECTDRLLFKVLGKETQPLKSDELIGSATLNGSQLYPTGFDGELYLTGETASGKLRLKIMVCDGIAKGLPPGPCTIGVETTAPESPFAARRRDGSAGTSPSTPTSGRFRTHGALTPVLRATQTSSSSTSLAVKTQESNNSSLIGLVRRELEHLESRLSMQITRVRDGAAAAMQKTDKLREVSQARLDAKVAASEVAMTKLDRKMSEVTGALRGLSDEAQAQIRRADSVDTRLWEFRHQLEDEFRQKLKDMSMSIQEISSNHRVTLSAGEDTQKRLSAQVKRIDGVLQERTAQTNDAEQAIVNLQARVEAVEETCRREMEDTKAAYEELRSMGSPTERATSQTDTRFWQLEAQISDMAQKVERLFLEAHGDRGWEARFQEHEVRLTGMRAKLDSQDEHYASFDERFRLDWESRYDNLRKLVQEATGKHLDGVERLESLQRWAEATDRAYEELRKMCTGYQAESSCPTPKENSQMPRIDALGSNIRALADQVQIQEGSIFSIREKLRDVDRIASAKSQQESQNDMDVQRRMVKVEHDMNVVKDDLQSQAKLMADMRSIQSPRELPSSPAYQHTVHSLDERTKTLEEKLTSTLKIHEEMRSAVMNIRSTSTSETIDDLRSQIVWCVGQLSGTEASGAQGIEALRSQVAGLVAPGGVLEAQAQIADLREEVASLTLRMPSAERLERKTADLSELTSALCEIQKDAARHLAETGVDKVSPPGGSTEGATLLTSEDAREVRGLMPRVAATEVAVTFLRGQLDDVWSHLLAMLKPSEAAGSQERRVLDVGSELVPAGPRPEVAGSGLSSPYSTAMRVASGVVGGGGDVLAVEEAGTVGAQIVTQELSGLFRKVEEGEMECASLQDQLKGRIATMDKLLDKVAREVLGPETGSPIQTAVPDANAAVETISRTLPEGLRLCILGGTGFHSKSSMQLVEVVAKGLGEKLVERIILLTAGMAGVQETFAKNIGRAIPVVNLVTTGEVSGFGVGQDIAAGENIEDRMVLLGKLGDVYLTIEGGPVVAKEAKAAFARGATVLPLISTGGASAGMFDFPQGALLKPAFATEGQWACLKEATTPPETVAEAVIDIILTLASARPSK